MNFFSERSKVGLKKALDWAAWALILLCAAALVQNLTLRHLEKSFVAEISGRLEDDKLLVHPDSCVAFLQLAANNILESTYGRMGVSSAIHNSRAFPLSPTLSMAVFGQGACGNISLLTVEVFANLGIEMKAVQLLNTEGVTMHVIVEAQMECGTVFVDPLYAWVYQDEGQALRKEELTSQWAAFTNGAPWGLKRYVIGNNLRYTNWSALGVFSGPVKSLAALFIGAENLDEFSLRNVLPSFYETRIISLALMLLAIIAARIRLR